MIYNMIKEVDNLVESHNTSETGSIPKLQGLSNYDGDNNSIDQVSSMLGFGAALPKLLVNDYAEMLKIAIEIF